MLSNSWHVFFFYVYIIYIHGITEYCLKKIKQWDQDSSLFEQIQAPKVAVLLHLQEEVPQLLNILTLSTMKSHLKLFKLIFKPACTD